MAKEVTDANEVAGALGELSRETVPEVVGADLGSTLTVEASSERGFAQRVTAVELGEDHTSFRAR